jgi:hypothetical protein
VTVRPIKTKALCVPNLEEDLIAGRALIKSKHKIIMDEEDSLSGIFPVVEKGIDPAIRFPYAESEGLFYIETIPMSEAKNRTMSGYGLPGLWHKRLSHAPIQSLKATWRYHTTLERATSSTRT